ncbi:MAG TPA: hypothetical protein VFX98_10065 [Longimicrobiaceae bacterium]|nr:hypothetical protein [Longimicrobiaceae bacterium]
MHEKPLPSPSGPAAGIPRPAVTAHDGGMIGSGRAVPEPAAPPEEGAVRAAVLRPGSLLTLGS